MGIASVVERVALKIGRAGAIEGKPCFDRDEVMNLFLSSPHDLLPTFQGPPGSKLKGGRGKDHPRYGRFVYAFAKHYQPNLIVEVGTYAGGTAIGWARALLENGQGKLICVDNDTYSKQTFPTITWKNLEKIGASREQVELRSGDSRKIIPDLARQFNRQVSIYLVDGDHTYEGALADILNGLPMVKPGGFLLVHDVDRNRRMDEMTEAHPHPVHEAFMKVVQENHYDWCILKFIRKHLGLMKIK